MLEIEVEVIREEYVMVESERRNMNVMTRRRSDEIYDEMTIEMYAMKFYDSKNYIRRKSISINVM